MKKSTAKSIIKDIVIVAVGVAAIWIGLQIVFGTQNPFYVVSSGSMIPVLQVYDVLVVDGKVPFEEIKISDIIVFNRPNGHDRVIVHRVVAELDDDPKAIRTKGDANPVSIPGTDYPITEAEYIGKVAYVIPQIGYVTRILAPPINYIIIAVIIGIMVVKQYAGKKDKPKFGDDQPENLELERPEFEKKQDAEYSDARPFESAGNEDVDAKNSNSAEPKNPPTKSDSTDSQKKD